MKYRKKPVVIDAVQLKDDDYSILNVLKFISEVDEINMSNPFGRDSLHNYFDEIKREGLYINTLEGKMHASIGDYIIKGIAGEFYPCKPDIFEATYEKVEEQENCMKEIIREPIKPKNAISAQLENSYTYHAPKDDQPQRYEALRGKAKELAHMIDELCPNSREKSLAHTNLEQAVMWANKSIACNE